MYEPSLRKRQTCNLDLRQVRNGISAKEAEAADCEIEVDTIEGLPFLLRARPSAVDDWNDTDQ